jgi:hypothetical protein
MDVGVGVRRIGCDDGTLPRVCHRGVLASTTAWHPVAAKTILLVDESTRLREVLDQVIPGLKY